MSELSNLTQMFFDLAWDNPDCIFKLYPNNDGEVVASFTKHGYWWEYVGGEGTLEKRTCDAISDAVNEFPKITKTNADERANGYQIGIDWAKESDK